MFSFPPLPTYFGVEASGLSFSYFISAELNFIGFYVIDPVRHIAKTSPFAAPRNLTDFFMNIPALKQPWFSVGKLLELGKQNTLQGKDRGALRRIIGNTNMWALSTTYFKK